MPRRRSTLRLILPLTALILVVAVVAVVLTRSDSGSSAAATGGDEQRAEAVAVQPSPSSSSQASERTTTLTPLGHLNPGDQGFHGDVWAHKGFAYMGTWGSGGLCPATGVKIIDLSDPSAPRQVSTAAAIPGTSQEDIVVRSVTSPAFTGDLMAVGIQSCSTGNGSRGGLQLYDVTDPRQPVELGFLPTGARGVHELDLVQQGERVLALLAVPDSEALANRGGDFRIVDVSDPRRPQQIGDWGARAALGVDLRGGIGCVHRTYGHSARASADGQRAYLSYWDAGVIILDISDPANPRFVGRATYPSEEPGTTHSVAEADGGRYLLSADEETVFETPPGLSFQVTEGGGTREFHGCTARFSADLDDVGVVEAELIDAGRACPGAALLAEVEGRVAVVEEGGCAPSEKAARLAGAGARAVILGVSGDLTAGSGGTPQRVPVVYVSSEDAGALRAAADGGASVTLPTERPWGGLRIWDIDDPSNPKQVGAYQTPNSLRFPAPTDGYYTIHNPEVTGDLAILSWWTDGVRVVDISDPARPRELAAYVPPGEPNPQRAIFPDGTMVWGVALAGDLVLLSDVNSGLHVLRLT